jgi:glutamyl-tRNA synthetase
MEKKKIRLRYAPSPTGPQHIGGIRTALYSYLFAKKHGGDFLLRIEDTDQTRFVEGAEEYILESLKWCGIRIDEGVGTGGKFAPYRQSERKALGIYGKYSNQLIEGGHAYYAFDTAEELEQMRQNAVATNGKIPQYDAVNRMQMRNSLSLPADEVKSLLETDVPYVIRLKVPDDEVIKFTDLIRGEVSVHSSQLDDKVLIKSDGMPTYHLAHIVDDYLMEISHAVRGEEWLPSAPAHILIYRYLGLEGKMPGYAHLPLLLRPDGNGKLSKRDGDRLGFPTFPITWTDPKTGEVSVGYRERGYLPDAFLNMLALLGWNSGTEQEIFSMNELIAAFSFERVNKSGARFDPEKAKWFNQQFLRRKENKELAVLLLAELKKHNLSSNIDYAEKVCKLMKEKIHFISDIPEHAAWLFAEPEKYDLPAVKKKWNSDFPVFGDALISSFEMLETFDMQSTENSFKETAEKLQMQAGSFMQLFRICLSGLSGGPALFEIAEVLGKEKVIQRIRHALEFLPQLIEAKEV